MGNSQSLYCFISIFPTKLVGDFYTGIFLLAVGIERQIYGVRRNPSTNSSYSIFNSRNHEMVHGLLSWPCIIFYSAFIDHAPMQAVRQSPRSFRRWHLSIGVILLLTHLTTHWTFKFTFVFVTFSVLSDGYEADQEHLEWKQFCDVCFELVYSRKEDKILKAKKIELI